MTSDSDGLSDRPSLLLSQVVRLEPEMIEIDAAGLVLLAHPSSDLRSAALKLIHATRALFFARKHAYDRAVSDRIAVLHSSQGLQPSVMASAAPREISELRAREISEIRAREISELRARLVRAEQVR